MKKKSKKPLKRSAAKIINDYDEFDVSSFIDKSKPLKFEDLGLKPIVCLFKS